eukprot:1153618-Pleurochrysis_carterae.AAC.1
METAEKDAHPVRHVHEERDAREGRAQARVVAQLDVLRRRDEARGEEDGGEEPASDQDVEGRGPLEVGDCPARLGGGAKEAEQVLGPDVGDEEREADCRPLHRAAGQEEGFGGGGLGGAGGAHVGRSVRAALTTRRVLAAAMLAGVAGVRVAILVSAVVGGVGGGGGRGCGGGGAGVARG